MGAKRISGIWKDTKEAWAAARQGNIELLFKITDKLRQIHDGRGRKYSNNYIDSLIASSAVYQMELRRSQDVKMAFWAAMEHAERYASYLKTRQYQGGCFASVPIESNGRVLERRQRYNNRSERCLGNRRLGY